jgi:hypothetical protein
LCAFFTIPSTQPALPIKWEPYLNPCTSASKETVRKLKRCIIIPSKPRITDFNCSYCATLLVSSIGLLFFHGWTIYLHTSTLIHALDFSQNLKIEEKKNKHFLTTWIRSSNKNLTENTWHLIQQFYIGNLLT